MASPYSDPYEEWKALGRPGGSFQAWQAGQATPQVSGGPVAPQAAIPAGPGAFNQAWMNEGLQAYAAGQRGSDPTRTPGFDPNTFRQTYGAMQGGNRPEDLARFSDATLAGWMPFYDPSQGKYRSMRGAEGWFDKPTECPPGMVPGGPNETDPCISPGGQTAPKETAPGAVAVGGRPPGTGGLEPIPSGLPGNITFPNPSQIGWTPGTKSGAVMATPEPSLTGTMMGLQAGDRLPSAPAQSPLTGVMAPLQTPGFPAAPKPVQPANFGLGTGWGSTQGGLAGMMAQQQRKRRPNSWF